MRLIDLILIDLILNYNIKSIMLQQQDDQEYLYEKEEDNGMTYLVFTLMGLTLVGVLIAVYLMKDETTCDATHVLMDGKCVTRKKCIDAVYDVTTNTCKKCIEDTVYDVTTNSCKRIACPTDQTRNAAGECKWIACPTDQTRNAAGECKRIACPTDQTRNAAGECKWIACPTDQTRNAAGECKWIACPTDQTRNAAGECKWIACPTDQTRNAAGECVEPAFTAYKSKGCYIDNANRAMGGNYEPGTWTIDSCAQHAKSNKSKLFSMQYGMQCFIDRNGGAVDYDKYGAKTCSTRAGYPEGSGDGYLNEVYSWN
jgi:hypothetical protein